MNICQVMIDGAMATFEKPDFSREDTILLINVYAARKSQEQNQDDISKFYSADAGSSKLVELCSFLNRFCYEYSPCASEFHHMLGDKLYSDGPGY